MKKIIHPDIGNKLFVNLVKEKLQHHTCQLLEKGGIYGYKPRGTGVLINIQSKYYIFTAAHVTDGVDNLYINTKRGIKVVDGYLRETNLKNDKKNDAAYIILDDKLIEIIKESYNFLPEEKIRVNHKSDDTTQYLTLGFPEVNIKAENGIVRTGSSFVLHSLEKEHVYEYYKFNKHLYYIVNYAGKGTDMVSNKKQKINPEPYGISGCGLWYIIVYEEGDVITLDYELIGIMTEFIKGKYFVLVGCKVDVIIGGIIMEK